MPPANQVCQKDLVEKYGADVKYVNDPEAGHNMASDVPAQMITWIYGNISGSGIGIDDPLKDADSDWSSHGTFAAFD